MNCDPKFLQPTPPIGNTQIEYSTEHIPIDLIYSDLLMRVLEEGQEHNDRTGVGTLSLFNVNMTWEFPKVGMMVPTNINDRGKSMEFSAIPLLTGKKIHTKSMLVELVWFLRAETTLDYLHRYGVSIWDEWKRPYDLESRRLVKVSPREPVESVPFSGSFSHYNKDYSEIDAALAKRWTNMIRRCYDSSHDNYKFYGGVGVTVHPDWHNPEKFISDAKNLPHWEYAVANIENFEIDKDYYQANQYGPNTSVWLSMEENALYMDTSKIVLIETPEGNRRYYLSISAASKAEGIPRSSLHRWITEGKPSAMKGNNKKYEDWEFSYYEMKSDKKLRYALIKKGDLGPVYGGQWRKWVTPNEYGGGTVDQIFNLVDGIRNNPNSRRHMLVGYNPGVVHQQALPACHAMAQFSVRPETRELDLIVYQRSADAFLGVPFNIASYAMLQWLMGMATGYRCGKLHFNFGDFHIYSNHLAQVHKYLRNVRKEIFCTPIIGFDVSNIHGQGYSFEHPPMLDLFNKVTSTTSPENAINFGYENFSMQEYESHPVISAPVAV